MRKILFFILLIVFQGAGILCRGQLFSEKEKITRQDTLRGSITPERAWWDVLKYTITVVPDPKTKTIRGSNRIDFKTIADGQRMQIDMQVPMQIKNVQYGKEQLPVTRDGNAYFVLFPKKIKKGTVVCVDVSFEGQPHEAVKPPWDGGWIWKKDNFGNPWMSVACQGIGGSVWYPCKDHWSDEPDSATLNIVVPDDLVGIGNGRLRNLVKNKDGTTTYTWAVVNPINNYNIVPYIGKYVNWSESYNGEKGKLDLNYWVLKEHLSQAKKQFQQVPVMLKCFEYWFGPYPFYEDGYKLVESPHLGMEHQSAIAYGNRFENGYLGTDLSGTGWGKKWDFIILHESGHEWFGNNITIKDVADMWVHEGFTNYSECLFTQCAFGKEAGNQYCIGLRKNIDNDIPLIGPYGVNKEGSGDMYYKGANLVHTIRQIIDDDELFRSILRGMNKDFYHQTVTSAQIERYLIDKSGKDLSPVFDQYLRTIRIPEFQFDINRDSLKYRWSGCVKGFNMPLKIMADKPVWLHPTEEWQTISLTTSTFTIDPNFYVNSRKM